MPVQKGKKRRRLRSRYRQVNEASDENQAGTTPQRTPTQRPARRRSVFDLPQWAYAPLGILIILVGVYFFFIPGKGIGLSQRILFLVLYLAMGGFYLYRAVRGYLQKRR